jgi:hypothetical protein
MWRALNAVLILFLVISSGVLLAADKPILAVFNVEARSAELSDATLENLGEYLCSLMSANGYQVIPRSDLKARLSKQKAQSHRMCYDKSCQIEIGREMAAQKTLSGQVIKLGSKCKVTLTLYDLKKSASEAGAVVSGACDEDGIVQSIDKAVAELVKGNKPAAAKEEPPQPAKKKRAWLGVEMRDLDEKRAKLHNAEPFSGVLIAGVRFESPAHKSGLKKGDIILSFNGLKVRNWKSLAKRIASLGPGRTVVFDILRKGVKMDIIVKLGEL